MLSIGGYIDTLVIQGLVKKHLFKHWIEYTVLPLLILGYYILVIDNCSSYFGIVQELCDLAGV